MSMPSSNTPLIGFPDADSAGVRAGVELQRYDGDITVTTDGAVISGLEIHGTLRVEADNVIIRDCKIINDSYNNIIIPDPYSATVEYCDIIGGVNGISGAGTFRGNDFSQNENGINVYGPSLIEDNYIHDMGGGSDAHFDGIENNGASGMIVRHNTIINDSSQTSAIMLNNYFGKIEGAIIDNNYLAGGGYTIYSDGRAGDEPISGVQITNNYLGEGYWGYYAFMENEPLVRGNHELGHDWPKVVSDDRPTPDDDVVQPGDDGRPGDHPGHDSADDADDADDGDGGGGGGGGRGSWWSVHRDNGFHDDGVHHGARGGHSGGHHGEGGRSSWRAEDSHGASHTRGGGNESAAFHHDAPVDRSHSAALLARADDAPELASHFMSGDWDALF
jgi:hypothetical protein